MSLLGDRQIMRNLPKDLQAINLTSGTRQLRLQQLETGEWQTLSQENAESSSLSTRAADPKRVSQLIQTIQTLSANAFTSDDADATDLKSFGFDQARLRIDLLDNTKNSTTLLLAHPKNNESQLYAKRVDEASIYEVDRAIFRQIL